MAKTPYFPGERAIPPVSVERIASRIVWPLKPHLVQFASGRGGEVTIRSFGFVFFFFFSKV